MEKWIIITSLLCIVGFSKDFRPSEHFIYEYLTGEWWGLSGEVVQQDVYPYATYGYLVQTLFFFLIIDFLRYKPVIVLLGLAGITIWSILIWSSELYVLQIAEVIYGTYLTCEIAYYTYLYAIVPKEKYDEVTSYVRSSILLGRFLSGVISQFLISFECTDFRGLHYITFAAQIVATIFAIVLPCPKSSIYFNQEDPEKKGKCKLALLKFLQHFKLAYKNPRVFKWSIWWAMATAGFIQVQSYIQPLWKAVEEHKRADIYNGAVEAILTLLGAAAAISPAFLHLDWTKGGMILISGASIIQGSALIISAQTNYIIVTYICYILFGVLYHFTITVISAQIAKIIPEDSYGLVFGINTFCALLLQTFILFIFVEDFGFALKPRDQFFVYGAYFFVITIMFIIFSIYTCDPEEDLSDVSL